MEIDERVERRPAPVHHPALDGLRGLAVAGVLLFHGDALPGGYLGVDAFFVLSGFLITTLLLQEHRDHGRVALSRFWGRRARRLIPALLGTLIGVALYAAFVAAPAELTTIRRDAIATVLYVANWRAAFTNVDYFAMFRSPSPLQHTWSLSIEEQFYLVWPLLVVGLARWSAAREPGPHALARRVLGASLGLGALSFAVMQVVYDPADPARAYYGTDTRASAILIGAALAALLVLRAGRPLLRRRSLGAAAAGCVVLLGLMWAALEGDAALLYRGGFLLAGLAVAVVIVAAVAPEPTLVRSVLGWAPLRALGLISYGAYLWHWPLYVWLDEARLGWSGAPLLAIRLAATIAVATVSYHLLEQPVRRRSFTPGGLRRLAATGVLATLAIMVVLVRVTATPTWLVNFDNAGPDRAGATWAGSLAAWRAVAERPGTRPRVLVLGDSVATTLGAALPATAAGDPLTGAAVGVFGCSLTPGALVAGGALRVQDERCADAQAYYADALAAFEPDVAVLMVGPWEMFDRGVDGTFVPAGNESLTRRTQAAVEQVADLAQRAGARFVIVRTPCFDPENIFPGARAVLTDPVRRAWVNGIWDQAARARPGTRIVDPGGWLCPGGRPVRDLDGAPVRYDGVHFTAAGAERFWAWLADELHIAPERRSSASRG